MGVYGRKTPPILRYLREVNILLSKQPYYYYKYALRSLLKGSHRLYIIISF